MGPSVNTQESTPVGRVMGLTESNWTRATAAGTGLQLIGVALKKSVELKAVSLAVQEVARQHAILRCQIVELPKGKYGYCVPAEPCTPVEAFPWPILDKRARTREASGVLSLPGDVEEDHELSLALAKVCEHELNVPFPRAIASPQKGSRSGPVDVLRIHVYSDPSMWRTLIVLKFNSGAFDRPSVRIASQSFLSALNDILGGKVPCLPDSPGKDMVLPSLEELIPGKALKSMFRKGIDTVSYAMSANKFSLFPFSAGYSTVESKYALFRTEVLSYTLGKDGTAALFASCERERTTYAAALTIAFLTGVADVKELKEKKLDKFSFTSLLDCRHVLEPPIPALALGSYTAGVSQDEHVKPDADFWERARAVSTGAKKELCKMSQFAELPVLNMLFSQLLKRPGLTQKGSLRTALFSLFLDGPFDSQWKDVTNLAMAGTVGPFASTHGIGPCFCLGESLLEGPEMTLSLVYPTPVYSKEQMEALVRKSFETLNAALSCNILLPKQF